MQLIHDHRDVISAVKDLNMNSSDKVQSSEVKEKSSGSLLLMNPVASGDNMATGLNSAHKLKDDTPPLLVPCCEGRELQINEDLVCTGLSAISVRHASSVTQCLSMSSACLRMQVPPGLMKHRNSFRSLHHPDLKRVPYLRRMTPDELETLFRGYAADLPSRAPAKCQNQEVTKLAAPVEKVRAKDLKDKETIDVNGASAALRPIPETRSCAEDVPAAMRLHGARARLYTSVLAGAKAGDQTDAALAMEYDVIDSDETSPEEEVQLKEELQILLPPRCDDVTAGSSTLASNDAITTS